MKNIVKNYSKISTGAVTYAITSIMLCICLNFFTTENSLAQNKKPKQQSLDTLPPEPEWFLCPYGVNICGKRYVYDRPDDPQIRSNLKSITLDEEKSYNFKLSYDEFEPCVSPFTSWKMEIINQHEDALGVVTFTDCAGNDTTLYIQNYIFDMNVSPNCQDFGFHQVGDTVDKMFYIKNNPNNAPYSLIYLELKRKDWLDKPQGFTLWDSTGTNPLPTFFKPGISINSLDSFPFIIRFVATEEGEFWDSIGVGDSCVFEYKAYVYALVEPPIGITDNGFNNKKIEIYPNPASEYIEIKLSESFELSESYQIKILDVLGNEKINYELPITNYDLVVDVKDLPEGIYFVRIITNNFTLIQKFIKLE